MTLYAKGIFTEDPWRKLEADGPAHAHALLTLAQWRARGAEFAGLSVGLWLEPGLRVEDISGLNQFGVIALEFPKYTDGRAFSMARQLRAQGYKGDIRAVGNVLFDQLQLMARCGFDSFDISHPATLRLLKSGQRPDLEIFYQPGLGSEVPAGTRPWTRKRAS